MRRLQEAQTDLSLWDDAKTFCDNNLRAPFAAVKRSLYELHQICDVEPPNVCIPFADVAASLNTPETRKRLDVNPTLENWQIMNLDVNQTFTLSGDIVKSYNSYVTDLLDDDIRVLIYAGDANLTCNWERDVNQGTRVAWERRLQRSGRAHVYHKR